MEKVREGKRTVVEVDESGEHSPTALIPTLLTFTNFTYYHAPKFLSTTSIESIVFGHWIVFVGRWCWRPPSGGGAWRPAAAKTLAAVVAANGTILRRTTISA